MNLNYGQADQRLFVAQASVPWQALLRDLARLDRSRMSVTMAARKTIGVLLPVIAGHALGQTPAGVIAGVGGLLTSYSDGSDGCGSHPDHAASLIDLRRGARVSASAAFHRSLRASARRCRIRSPVASFHLEPGRFMRMATRLLQVASTLPLPTGNPFARAQV